MMENFRRQETIDHAYSGVVGRIYHECVSHLLPNSLDFREHFNRMSVKETDKKFEIKLELAGCSKDSIKIELNRGLLTITADKEEKKGEYILDEMTYGAVFRSYMFYKEVDVNNIKASYENGVLTINAPIVDIKSTKTEIKLN